MRPSLIGVLRRRRVLVLMSLDSLAWIVAMYTATAFRLNDSAAVWAFDLADARKHVPLTGVLVVGSSAALLHCLIARIGRLHQGRSMIGSFEEIVALGLVDSFVGAVATLANTALTVAPLPRTVPAAATALAFMMMAWPRALWRVTVDDVRPSAGGPASTPVLVIGAGSAGRQLIGSMRHESRSTWAPVGMVDDDPSKQHLRVQGVGVLGTIGELAGIARRLEVTTVVIAIPSATSETVLRITELTRGAGLAVKVVPSVRDLGGPISPDAVRDLAPEDLLGRSQIEIDLRTISDYLRGHRVLVTGAGGSIGSELCRQIAGFEPAELAMLDRDESALHALLLSMRSRADLGAPDVVLADIRDADRLHEVFEAYRPDIVFHAAALKHLSVLQTHVSEAIKTNVLGTLNVLEACAAVGVWHFVNISTDKAADPTSVLGYSKRIAERLTAGFAERSEGTYLSVRFGNVLGTRGSMLDTFASQVRSGGPVTVTHPEVTRYFMTVGEAAQLVIQAAAIGSGGEALVLEMGSPIRVLDLAKQVIDQSGRDVPIVIIGLEPGEKLHETLLGSGETGRRPVHPLVCHVAVPILSVPDVLGLPVTGTNASLNSAMVRLSGLRTATQTAVPMR